MSRTAVGCLPGTCFREYEPKDVKVGLTRDGKATNCFRELREVLRYEADPSSMAASPLVKQFHRRAVDNGACTRKFGCREP